MSDITKGFSLAHSRVPAGEIVREELVSKPEPGQYLARFGVEDGVHGMFRWLGYDPSWHKHVEGVPHDEVVPFSSPEEAEDCLMMDEGDAITIYRLVPVRKVYANQALKARLDKQGNMDLNQDKPVFTLKNIEEATS